MYIKKTNRMPKGYWTKERCHQEAKKYKHKNDFRNGNRLAYKAASKESWYGEITSHMIPLGSMNDKTLYVYLCHITHSAYVGSTCKHEVRHRTHMTKSNSAVYKHMKSNSLSENDFEYIKHTTTYDVYTICDEEQALVEKYRNDGWNILNIIKCGGLGGGNLIWNKKKCQEEALKYNTRNEFSKGCVSAYNSSRRKGWLDIVCSHMIAVRKPNGYWTYEKCKEEALKYDTRNEFKKGSGSAYIRSKKEGWLDEFFPKK